MKKTYFLLAFLFSVQMMCAQRVSVIIPEGSTISLKINQNIKITSKLTYIVVSVDGDVYDESGEYVVIEDGAPAEMRVSISKPDLWSGDRGRIVLTPTSVETITGRTIALKEKWFTVDTKVIRAGTPFTTYTSKDIKLVLEL